MMERAVLLVVLAAFAWTDVKKKELSLPLMGGCAAVGLLFFLIGHPISWGSLLGGICIGGVLLLCALIAKGSIGLGDGLLFCVTGLYLGLWGNLVLLFLSAVFCAIAGLVMVVTRKYTKKTGMPFAPYVLLADVALLALSI